MMVHHQITTELPRSFCRGMETQRKLSMLLFLPKVILCILTKKMWETTLEEATSEVEVVASKKKEAIMMEAKMIEASASQAGMTTTREVMVVEAVEESQESLVASLISMAITKTETWVINKRQTTMAFIMMTNLSIREVIPPSQAPLITTTRLKKRKDRLYSSAI